MFASVPCVALSLNMIPISEFFLCVYMNLMQKHLQCKKVWPSKVESYLEVNA